MCCHSGDAEKQGEAEENSIGLKGDVYEGNGGQETALQCIYDIELLRGIYTIDHTVLNLQLVTPLLDVNTTT